MKLTTYLGAASVAALATAVSAQDADLLVFDWSGYEEEGFYQQYIDTHGSAPTFAFFGEEEEAFQKLRSGFRADISHPCPHSVQKWRDAGLIEPWDISQIPSYATLAENFKTDSVFTDGDDVYFIPADNGATALLYNTEEVSAEDAASLQVFLDPAYAGRTSLPDNVDDSFALAYLATGTTDWTQATQEDFERAAAWLREAHQNARTYWADGAELNQLMATGEVVVAWSWNESYVGLADEGHPVAFNREAEEGSSQWFCGYVNLVDGPGSEEKAHDFVEAWLQPSSAEYIVNEWGYAHANTEAMASFDDETLAAVGMGQPSTPVLAQLPMDIELREQMIETFERIKAGF
ncbi:extracellular solute-binding protein [Salibaculum griseiflavum]|uniref:Polyamine ABC transporter substrate-binding protein n=1 Tax=Salibaculum griseiflavum TaxID=1914409 RepID=A0A2V1P6K2_9RHOB|nr:extracellular solute-binding protein [Salibaculum griseiflavum]PWG17418.1 polyamine ABC transporter substrate-binding protein [Salibaculum griseiflavum]